LFQDRHRSAAPQKGLGGDVNFNFRSGELKAARVKKPAEMIAIADATSVGDWDFNLDPRYPKQYPSKLHDGGANVLFCDGHVTWYQQKDLIIVDNTPRSLAIARMWNNDNEP
jgi:prepilin-type processing-associated H-X9-DG protein